MTHMVTKFVSPENRRWRTAVIFEIEKLPHLNKGLTDRHNVRHDDKLTSLTIMANCGHYNSNYRKLCVHLQIS